MGQTVEPLTKKLSLAIKLVDDFTKQAPIGKVSVNLVGEKRKIARNLSGYYLFLDLPVKEYSLQTRSDFYFDETSTLTVTAIDPESTFEEKTTQILKEIVLKPNPSYPFPNGATLIRGIVQDQKQNSLHSANVSIVEKSLLTSTTEKGEYVFCFSRLTGDDVIIKDGKRYLKPKPTSKTTILTIRAVAKNSAPIQVTIAGLEESTCLSVPAIKLYITS